VGAWDLVPRRAVASRLLAFLRFYRPRRARKGQGAWSHAIDLDIGFPQLHETHIRLGNGKDRVCGIPCDKGGRSSRRTIGMESMSSVEGAECGLSAI